MSENTHSHDIYTEEKDDISIALSLALGAAVGWIVGTIFFANVGLVIVGGMMVGLLIQLVRNELAR